MPYREHWNEADIWRDDTAQAAPDLVSRDALLRAALVGVGGAIGLGVGAAGLGAAQAGPSGPIWLALFALAGALAVLLSRHLELGLTLFLGVCWLSVGTPGLAKGGSGSEKGIFLSEVGLVGLLAVWLIRRLLRREGCLASTPLLPPMVLYLAVGVWSTLHSLLFPDPHVLATGPKQFLLVNVVEVVLRCLALGAVLLVGNVLRGPWVKRAVAAFALGSVVSWLVGYTPLKGLSSQFMAFPQAATLGLFAGYLLTRQGARWLRGLMGLALLGLFIWICIQNAQWVSGVTAALGTLAIVVFALNRRTFAVLAAVGLVVAAANWGYVKEKLYDENFYSGGRMNWGLTTLRGQEVGAFENDRTRMLRASLRYAEAFPLGVGLGNYRAYNSYYGRADVWNTTTFTSAHGTYAQTLSETGWPGLLALLWLLGAVLTMQGRLWRALPVGWARTTVLGLMAGAASTIGAALMGDYLFPTYHNGGLANFGSCVYFWLSVGLSLAVARAEGVEWRDVAGAKRVRRPVAPIYQRGPFPAALAPPEETA